MIRKFFSLVLFIATVGTASFGQHLVGKDDIDRWAHQVRSEGPGHATIALQKTDQFLGNLSTQAGQGDVTTCTFADPLAKSNA